MHPALDGLTVLERGWLSSNNLVIHGAAGEPGAVLVDTGHVVHAEQTVALVRHALRGAKLHRIVNTHLHSDHCGGNAAVQRAFGAPITVPPGNADAVAQWDRVRLTHATTGQLSERFQHASTLRPGEHLRAGGRRWDAVAAPGHDPHSLMLFDAAQGVLVSADALWQHGFGVVFPEVDGEPGFGDVAATLDAIERLPVRVVIPGHGAPFTDVKAALQRARSRLDGFLKDPGRHARHATKVLIKYHVMELHRIAHADLLQWAAATPNLVALWQRHGGGEPIAAWCDRFVGELVAQRALARDGPDVLDA
jgi:glyoxylase-like metal-dependent hydrolase (beta-lactamase superfamily II)